MKKEIQKEILTVKNINKSFTKNGEEQAILRNINLSIKSNEIVSFVGKSGAGKSTFLRIISGLLAKSSGSVTFNGEDVTKPTSNMSMVFQNFALLPWLNVFDNVAFGLEARGLPKKYIKDKTTEMLNLIGLSGYEKSYPKELSGGMRQRVGFARALAVEPDILLLDEPFSSLDIFTAHKLKNDLIELWESKKIKTSSIILVTHSVEEAVMMSDRVLVWDSNPGRIAKEIAIQEARFARTKRNMFEQVEDISHILNHHIAASEERRILEINPSYVANMPIAI